MGEGEPPLTFVELKMWARLKKRLKRGPRMTRVQRADYLRRLAREMGAGGRCSRRWQLCFDSHKHSPERPALYLDRIPRHSARRRAPLTHRRRTNKTWFNKTEW